MSSLNDFLDRWAKDNSEVFNRHSLTSSKLSISKGGALWKPPNVDIPKDFHHPGLEFFDTPPCIITKNFNYPKSEKVSKSPPKFDMFNFEANGPQKDAPTDLNEMVKYSPPLISMFRSVEINPIVDQRVDVGIIKPGPLSYYCAEYLRLSSTQKIFEPIVVSFFLWDMDKKTKLSEIWRFVPEANSFDKGIKALMNDGLMKAPTSINVPYTSIHTRIIAVVSLERLLMRSAGQSFNKYYEKNSSSNESSAKSDLKHCDQPNTTITFAWAHKALNELIPKGDPVNVKFDNFLYSQSVSDHYLDGFFSSHPKEKIAPFEVEFKFSNEKSNIEKLENLFSFPLAPSNHLVNKLIIRPVQARFRPPRKVKARNVLAEIQIKSKGNPLPLFNGETVFTTKTQYHTESPYFNDDIYIKLPLDFPTDAQLHVRFFHCSVKAKSKQAREPCGCAIYPLFNKDKTFIKEAVHQAGISYSDDKEIAEATDNNYFSFIPILRSSIFTSDKEVLKVFNDKIENLKPPDHKLLVPHIYGVLDVILRHMNNDDPKGFHALTQILSAFQRDRSHPDSQFLIFYIKFCALRHDGEDQFHNKLLTQWNKYLNDEPFTQKRPDFFCCWFLFELLVKSILLCKDQSSIDYPSIVTLTSTLSSYLPRFRDSGQNIGATLNRHLCLLYKDLFEISSNHGIIITMAKMHLEFLECDAQKNLFDRDCLRDFILNFLSPKIFLYVIAPTNNETSIFDQYFLPLLEGGLKFYEHTNDIFKLLFNLLLQYGPKEHLIIAPRLMPIVHMIGKSHELLQNYPSKAYTLYPLIISHYILYYSTIKEFDAKLGHSIKTLLIYSKKLTNDDKERIKEASKKKITPENITAAVTASLRTQTDQFSNMAGPPGVVEAPVEAPKTRKFASLKILKKNEMLNSQSSTNSEIEKSFDALAFCVQAISLKLAQEIKNVYTFNSIISVLCDLEIPHLLINVFNNTLSDFIEKASDIILGHPESNLKHLIRKFVANLDETRLDLINRCIDIEKKKNNMSICMKSLLVRAFYKEPPTEAAVKLCKKSPLISEFVSELYNINKDLAIPELKAENSDVYSDLLFRKAELMSISPDARVEMLLELTTYHMETQYYSEAVISKLTAAALVAEYLVRLGRIPNYFNSDSAAAKFLVACPSAISEIISPSIAQNLPRIRGYCSSKYFSEYGLIFLIMTAMDHCKRASLYELSTKIHYLLSPIAEYRHLWQLMQKHFFTGSHSWSVIETFSTSSDRSLGNYYKVQFQNGGTYIYRETNYANIWEIRDRLTKTSKYLSGGKEVVVINEGDELPTSGLDSDKYYIHVKAVTQYFTSEERMKRITVFEQNHNIDQFYFDIPFSKSSQTSIEHCCLKRKIIKLPHPLPYIVKRVLIPPENITEEIFSPIQYSCQNLQKQIDLIEEACARKMYKQLQPLIQGSLLVTVNEGPQKIAEVFLGRDDQDEEYQAQLRAIFRQFLKTNEKAVYIHAEYVKQNPVYAMLQDELEAGLNRLNSALQPYLSS